MQRWAYQTIKVKPVSTGTFNKSLKQFSVLFCFCFFFNLLFLRIVLESLKTASLKTGMKDTEVSFA